MEEGMRLRTRKSQEKKRFRVVRKRPSTCLDETENFEVASTYLVNAKTGKNIRAYLLACSGDKKIKRQCVQVSPKESRKYLQLIEKMQKECNAKIQGKIFFDELKRWSTGRKRELLA